MERCIDLPHSSLVFLLSLPLFGPLSPSPPRPVFCPCPLVLLAGSESPFLYVCISMCLGQRVKVEASWHQPSFAETKRVQGESHSMAFSRENKSSAEAFPIVGNGTSSGASTLEASTTAQENTRTPAPLKSKSVSFRHVFLWICVACESLLMCICEPDVAKGIRSSAEERQTSRSRKIAAQRIRNGRP